MTESQRVYPPSKYIKDELESRGWSQSDFATILGRKASEISLILAKEKISIEFALQLSTVLGNTPEHWLGLENKYRLSQAEAIDSTTISRRSHLFSNYPFKEMQKRGWINQTSTVEEIESELKDFFNTPDLEADIPLPVSFKRTVKDVQLNKSEKAWIVRAIQLAKKLTVGHYDEAKMPALLAKLRTMAAKSGAAIRVAEVLAAYGIRFVVVEPLPTSRIDGAAFWLGDGESPVIAMSIRFDNIGSFWFTLIHECTHIKYRDAFSLDDLESEQTDETEIRANREASELLVPQDKLEAFIRNYSPFYSSARVNNLATQLKIHPGIIVGQLQHRKEIGYNAHRKTLSPVRELVTTTAFTDGWGHPVPQVRN